jgi:serine/threonine protein kinase
MVWDYELLTGRPPFAASTRDEMSNEVRFRDPVPPSRLNSHVTADLEGFCLRCLRKNPWRRYHRAFDSLRRLRHFLDNPEGRSLLDERTGEGRSRKSP